MDPPSREGGKAGLQKEERKEEEEEEEEKEETRITEKHGKEMMASGPLPDDGDKEPHARHVESSNRDHAAVQDSSSPSPNSSGDSREEHRGTAKRVVHVDGTVGYVDRKAIGGEREGMPKGYFRSPQFVGTMVVRPHLFLPTLPLYPKKSRWKKPQKKDGRSAS